jgi:membrane protein required for colicin V production
MNWLDVVIIGCLAVGVIKGLFDGFIKQVVSLAGLASAIFFADNGATILQPLLENVESIPKQFIYPFCYALSFTLIFTLIAIAGRLLEKIGRLASFGCLNLLAGGVLGFVVAVISLSLALNLLVVFDKQIPIIKEETRKESMLFDQVRSVVPALYPHIKEKFEKNTPPVSHPQISVYARQYR